MSNQKMSPTQLAEAFSQVVYGRRSTRGFLPTAVQQETLDRIFSVAQQSPSNCNTQPWQPYVVSGEPLEKLRQRLLADAKNFQFSMDFPYDGQYSDIFKVRQQGAAKNIFEALGVERGDAEGRQASFLRNFEAYGAPHVVFLFMPQWCGLREAADVGLYAQTLMLALTAEGLASCPETCLGMNADAVRDELGIDESMKLLFGIAFGYEDSSQPVNQARTDRASVEETVTFIG